MTPACQIGRKLAIFFVLSDISGVKPRAMTPEVQKHVEYASGYLDLKMYDDAMQEADKALALAPNLSEAITIKSDVLCQANRLNEAEPFMAQLAELNPSDSAIW